LPVWENAELLADMAFSVQNFGSASMDYSSLFSFLLQLMAFGTKSFRFSKLTLLRSGSTAWNSPSLGRNLRLIESSKRNGTATMS
jgi:hypothetical protein